MSRETVITIKCGICEKIIQENECGRTSIELDGRTFDWDDVCSVCNYKILKFIRTLEDGEKTLNEDQPIPIKKRYKMNELIERTDIPKRNIN